MTNEEKEFLDEWRAKYEAILDDPESDCPECGVQLMQLHRPNCEKGKRDAAESRAILLKDSPKEE